MISFSMATWNLSQHTCVAVLETLGKLWGWNLSLLCATFHPFAQPEEPSEKNPSHSADVVGPMVISLFYPDEALVMPSTSQWDDSQGFQDLLKRCRNPHIK